MHPVKGLHLCLQAKSLLGALSGHSPCMTSPCLRMWNSPCLFQRASRPLCMRHLRVVAPSRHLCRPSRHTKSIALPRCRLVTPRQFHLLS